MALTGEVTWLRTRVVLYSVPLIRQICFPEQLVRGGEENESSLNELE